MNEELKEKWTAALRSGEYKQGKFNLYQKKNDTYCCLGVLGLVMGKTRDEMNEISDTPEWGLFSHEIEMQLAQEFNDGSFAPKKMKKTFPEIADWIDANL